MNDDWILESDVAASSGLPMEEVRAHRNGHLAHSDYERRQRRVFWSKNAAESFLNARCAPPAVSEGKTAPSPISATAAPICEFVIRKAHPALANPTVVEAVPRGQDWRMPTRLQVIRVRPGQSWRPGDRILASPFRGALWKCMGKPKPGQTYDPIPA